MRKVYFKRKAGAPIITTSYGFELPDIIITPSNLDVFILRREFVFAWSYYINAQSAIDGLSPIIDGQLGIQNYMFEFTEQTTPNLQQALNTIDWANGGEFSASGAQIVLDFFATQPDPTTPEDSGDTIGDNWDGMIYNP